MYYQQRSSKHTLFLHSANCENFNWKISLSLCNLFKQAYKSICFKIIIEQNLRTNVKLFSAL